MRRLRPQPISPPGPPIGPLVGTDLWVPPTVTVAGGRRPTCPSFPLTTSPRNPSAPTEETP